MNVHPLDLVVPIIVLAGAVRGWLRGFGKELADLLRFIAALALATLFYGPLGALLQTYTRLEEGQAKLIAWVLLFAAGTLLFILLKLLLKQIADFAFKKPVDRWCGLGAGAAKGALWAAILVLFAVNWPHQVVRRYCTEQSVCGQTGVQVSTLLFDALRARWPDLAGWLPSAEEGAAPEEDAPEVDE